MSSAENPAPDTHPGADPDSQERPVKRPREDLDQTVSNADEAMSGVTRSPELWIPDGNIVLIADKKVAFRVHGGVLARHSSVFSDAFGLPQPENGDTYDGCPVLHIPDQPIDVDCLLQALYDGIRFKALKPRVLAAFGPLASLLSLGHKYDIEHLREEAHMRIKTCFPHQFSEFRSAVVFFYQPGSGYVVRSSTLEVHASRDAIRAVNLARLVDDCRMLPMALYLCAQLPVSSLLEGTTSCDSENNCRDTLSRADLVRCLEARSILSERAYRKTARVWRSLSGSCHNPSQCQAIRMGRADAAIMSRVADTSPNPLSSAAGTIGLPVSRLCEPCARVFADREVTEMRWIWERLPGDLKVEVPGWDSTVPN
ncbi:hypothetical protein FKP32DRAFT_37288 [Trametes sanguinea]|nr:hypothetical protein FKP32DRAFT_37288 [Trametes sanguinea]